MNSEIENTQRKPSINESSRISNETNSLHKNYQKERLNELMEDIMIMLRHCRERGIELHPELSIKIAELLNVKEVTYV